MSRGSLVLKNELKLEKKNGMEAGMRKNRQIVKFTFCESDRGE